VEESVETKRRTDMMILWILLMPVVVIVVILMEGGNPIALLNVSAFVLVTALPLLAGLAVWGWKALSAGFSAPFRRSARIKNASGIWAFLEKMCYLSGLLGFVLGIVYVLSVLRGSELAFIENLGKGIAVCLVTVFYGLFLGMLCRIMKARVER
jgi:flagellar motor component MotA